MDHQYYQYNLYYFWFIPHSLYC